MSSFAPAGALLMLVRQHSAMHHATIFKPYRAYRAQTDKSHETLANISMQASPKDLKKAA
ncbi:MAG: hypothetical protein ACK5IJ_04435 [Mangrovibacterium sp.]